MPDSTVLCLPLGEGIIIDYHQLEAVLAKLERLEGSNGHVFKAKSPDQDNWGDNIKAGKPVNITESMRPGRAGFYFTCFISYYLL